MLLYETSLVLSVDVASLKSEFPVNVALLISYDQTLFQYLVVKHI